MTSIELANISTRASVSTGNDIVIAGFILGGNNGNDRIVVRGIGPREFETRYAVFARIGNSSRKASS